jgi:hypothetical protein
MIDVVSISDGDLTGAPARQPPRFAPPRIDQLNWHHSIRKDFSMNEIALTPRAPRPMLLGVIGIIVGGLIGLTGLGPVVAPPAGVPCLEHVMCAPEANHSPDLGEEPASHADPVATTTASSVTVTLPNPVRLQK